MAILLNSASSQTTYLGALHMFGRDTKRADTVLNNPDASQLHASIRWSSTCWHLLDHSRYGTLLDGKAIAPHVNIELAVGQTIRFGPGAQQVFRVLNLDPPCPLFLPVGHASAPLALQTPNTLHCLPDELAPQASIYLAANGDWWLDAEHCQMALHDGEQVNVAGKQWQFVNKDKLDDTREMPFAANPPPPDAYFDFAVSQNEEHTRLAISTAARKIDLGERTHHYCLLTLARQRGQDAQRGFDPLSQGWIYTAHFAEMLKVEEKHLNMMLHRARLQIAKEYPHGALHVHCIERRRGEVRFGSFGFQIRRGAHVEAKFDPHIFNPSQYL